MILDLTQYELGLNIQGYIIFWLKFSEKKIIV